MKHEEMINTLNDILKEAIKCKDNLVAEGAPLPMSNCIDVTQYAVPIEALTQAITQLEAQRNMIDITKPLRAKVLDADEKWFGASKMEVDVEIIKLPHEPYTKNTEILYKGGESLSFELLSQVYEEEE